MRHGYLNGIKIVGIAVAVYLGMRYVLPQVIPFLIAFLLVKLVLPYAAFFQEKLHIKRTVAGGIILTLFLGVFAIAACLLGMGIWKQLCNLAANLEIYTLQAEQLVSDCCQMVEKKTGIQALAVEDFVYDNLEVLEQRMQSYTVPHMVKNSISCMMSVAQWMAVFIVTVISVILILKDYDEIREKLRSYAAYEHVCHILKAMGTLGGTWLKAQLTIVLIVTTICVIGLSLLRYPYALLIGIIIGVTDAIPFIGTGTFLVPWAICLLITGRFAYGICLLILFGVTYMLREFLEPKLIGDQMGVYPIVMVITIYLGLKLYGVAGVFSGPISYLLIVQIYRELNQDEQEENDKTGEIV